MISTEEKSRTFKIEDRFKGAHAEEACRDLLAQNRSPGLQILSSHRTGSSLARVPKGHTGLKLCGCGTDSFILEMHFMITQYRHIPRQDGNSASEGNG